MEDKSAVILSLPVGCHTRDRLTLGVLVNQPLKQIAYYLSFGQTYHLDGIERRRLIFDLAHNVLLFGQLRAGRHRVGPELAAEDQDQGCKKSVFNGRRVEVRHSVILASIINAGGRLATARRKLSPRVK